MSARNCHDISQLEPPVTLQKQASIEAEKDKKEETPDDTNEAPVQEAETPQKKPIPAPPPLPTSWPPKVVNGQNVDNPAASDDGSSPGGAVAAMLAGRAAGNPLLAGGALSKGIAGLKRRSLQKPAGPKLKQFHWDMVTEVPTEGSLWSEKPPVEVRLLVYLYCAKV